MYFVKKYLFSCSINAWGSMVKQSRSSLVVAEQQQKTKLSTIIIEAPTEMYKFAEDWQKCSHNISFPINLILSGVLETNFQGSMYINLKINR